MKTIRIFTFFIFLFWQCPVISAQNTVNIIPLIHSAIIETGSDEINNERHVIEILKELPCNFGADTVFAIEYFSYIGNFLYLMYWSQKFRYSIEGPMDDTLKVYRERRFEKWLIEQVEEWNKDSIMGAQCGVYGPDETHYVIRIIFHSGQIQMDSFSFGHIETPADYKDDVYLWEYWINNEQKEPIATYKCPTQRMFAP